LPAFDIGERLDFVSARKPDAAAIEVFSTLNASSGPGTSLAEDWAEVGHVGVPDGLANEKREDT
jgi:hypothetical protein